MNSLKLSASSHLVWFTKLNSLRDLYIQKLDDISGLDAKIDPTKLS